MFCSTAISQTKPAEKIDTKQRWQDMQERIKYQRPNEIDYPDKSYGSPPGIEEENYYSTDEYNQTDGGVYFDDEDIERSRRKQFGTKGNKTEVKIEKNRKNQIEDIDVPDVDVPDVDLPDVDLPDIDLPDVDLPDVDLPNVDGSFWSSLLIIALIVGLAFLLYFLLVKNGAGTPKDRPIQMSDDDMWNPTVVTKSELELKLEEAIANEDYRSCVRIYFTFILKELIVKKWIRWEKEKTNHHYLLEMLSKPESKGFNKCVNIFEIVWYGDYSIQRAQYVELEPILKEYYKKLQNS